MMVNGSGARVASTPAPKGLTPANIRSAYALWATAGAGWATEISLDLDMVSATCPACKILLVQATNSAFANLGAAVNYAATQKVAAISNSYGGSNGKASAAYNHPGIAITASSGDNGYGVESPASYGTVMSRSAAPR